MGGRQGSAVFDIFMACSASRAGRRIMTGNAMPVEWRAPSRAVAYRRCFLMTPRAGIFFMTYRTVLSVPGGAYAVAALPPGNVMAARRIPAVAILA